MGQITVKVGKFPIVFHRVMRDYLVGLFDEDIL